MSDKKHEDYCGYSQGACTCAVASPQATRPPAGYTGLLSGCESDPSGLHECGVDEHHRVCKCVSCGGTWPNPEWHEPAAQPAAGTTIDQQFAGMATDEKYKAESAKICSEFDRLSEGTTPQAERPQSDLEEMIVVLRGIVSLKELKWSEDEYAELRRLQDRGVILLTKYEREFARAVAPVETLEAKS